MELPVCKVSFSNDDITDFSFLESVKLAIKEHFNKYRPFFSGLCYNCWAHVFFVPLQRCSGCQLVSYCSRDCQKSDWSRHRYVCKEFPIVNGKNVFNTKGSWKKYMGDLRERAARIPHAKPIFRNPRICKTCREARQDRLTDCRCACVAYCSKTCSQSDKHHDRDICSSLGIIGQAYFLTDFSPLLPHLRDDTVCEKFSVASSWDDIIPNQYKSTFQRLLYTEKAGSVLLEDDLICERVSYPMSLLYSLQALPGRFFRGHLHQLEELTNLTIHVVTSIPLFDSEPWEVFMHRLPMLKQLKVVYVTQGREFRQSFRLINLQSLRCNDCKDKDRVITFSVHQMQYHMFFSSLEYIEPDVVVVFGNTHEMLSNEEDDVHSEISYRNMTHSRDTVLVLMDDTKYLVEEGVKLVNDVQPVVQLVSPQINPLQGCSTNRAEIESDSAIINEKSYFACLTRK